MRNSEKFSKLLKNINIMHSNAPSKHKSNILSLFAKIFSRKELHNASFLFSNTQYLTAQYKAQTQDFSLNDYIRHIPISHTKTSSDTFDLIIHYLLQYSRNSTYKLGNITNTVSYPSFNISNQYFSQEVYYLEKNKNYIYNQLKTHYPNLKHS